MANIDYKCEQNHECYAPSHVAVKCCPQAACSAPVKRVGAGSRKVAK